MNELQKIVLNHGLSIKQVSRITGLDVIFVRAAISGQMKDEKKLSDFRKRLLAALP